MKMRPNIKTSVKKSITKTSKFCSGTLDLWLSFRAFHVCCEIMDFSGLKLLLVLKYVVRGHNCCAVCGSALTADLLPLPHCPDVTVQQPPALNTGSLSVCISLSLPSIQSCDSAPRRCSTTATFFSSC